MSHKQRKPYSRAGRILRARLRQAFAPRVADWELPRDRLGHTPPLASGIHVSSANRPGAADTARGMSQGK